MPGPKVLLPLTCSLAILLVVGLYYNTWQPNRQKNGFNRILVPAVLVRKTAVAASAVISGKDPDFVYLYAGTPGSLLKVNMEDFTIGQLRLAYIRPQKLMHTYISDSSIEVLDRNTAVITEFSSGGALRRIVTIPFPVSKGCRLAADTYLFKTVDTVTMRPNLVFFCRGKEKFWPLSRWAGANQDYFSQDGFLVADPDSPRGCYVFYYHNSILRVNAAGDMDLLIKTIDTISTSTVQGRLANDKGTRLMTLGAPSLVTNRSGCIASGVLFLYSGVMADNQDPAEFAAGRTIDRYDLTDGSYLSSVYLPPVASEKAKQFIVHGDQIYALYEHCFAVFQMAGCSKVTVRK